MRALRFDTAGDLANLRVVDRELPPVGADEVLVRVRAAGLNKSDISNVSGLFPYTTVPRTPGRDFAGVVESGPAHLAGRAVWGSGREIGFTRDGSHAEYVVLPAAGVAPKPESLSFAEAAACGVPFVTAWSAMVQCAVARDTRVVIVGAAGAVGVAALHLARMRGARVVGAVRKPAQAARLEARGFASIVLPESGPLAPAVAAHFPGGADVIFDTAGYWLAPSIAALAKFGRVATIVVHPKDGNEVVPVRALYRIGASLVGVNSLLYDAVEVARVFTELAPAFDRGELRAPDDLVERPLASGPDVYAELKRMPGAAKFVLLP